MQRLRHWLEILLSVALMLLIAVGVIILSYLHFQTVEASTSVIGQIAEKLDSK